MAARHAHAHLAGLGAEDLAQEGYIALMACAKRYRKGNCTIYGYARRRIWGAMVDAIRREAKNGLGDRARPIDDLCEDGRTPEEALAGMMPSPGGRDDPERGPAVRQAGELLAAHIGDLDRREQMIVSLLYFRQLSMREVGAILRVNESRISQLHAGILRKLRLAMGSWRVNGTDEVLME